MNYVRPLVLAASALAFFISACSQGPADLATPTLEPQYGSALYDYGKSVAVNPSGNVYALSLEATNDYISGTYDNAPLAKGKKLGVVTLRRFDRSGAQLWVARQDLGVCQDESCTISVREVAADRSGNAYVIYSADNSADYLVKYASNGAKQWQQELKNGTRVLAEFGLATDSKGAVYVSESYNDPSPVPRLKKYAPNGSIVWSQYIDVVEPRAVAVSSDDAVYVTGSASLGRFGSDGSPKWRRDLGVSVGAGLSVAASGSGSVYVAGNTTSTFSVTEPGENQIKVLRYTSAGSRQWVKTISTLGDAKLYSVTADAQGGVYLAGRTDPDYSGPDSGPPVTDYFTRKYNAAGSLVWANTAELPGTQVATDIAAFSADELYLTGLTNGKVNGNNFGLDDAFLLRLNGQGNRVWSR